MVSEFTIHANDLLTSIGTTKAPQLIDVCFAEDIDAASCRWPGAQHIQHLNLMNWVHGAKPSGLLMIICQSGFNFSHGVVARLRTADVDAHVLIGRNQAWFVANQPRLSLVARAASRVGWVMLVPANSQSLCLAWLIRWFDRDAELIWLPQAMVAELVDRFKAEPAPETLATSCPNVGLDYPPLSTFVAAIDAYVAGSVPLLIAVSQMHQGPEAQVKHAFHTIDAAWFAGQESAQ